MEALAIPVKLYIHYNANTFAQEKVIVSTCDMSRTFPDQYVLLETRDISIDVNQPEPFDIIALQVDQLRGQKEKIATLAKHQISRQKLFQILRVVAGISRFSAATKQKARCLSTTGRYKSARHWIVRLLGKSEFLFKWKDTIFSENILFLFFASKTKGLAYC